VTVVEWNTARALEIADRGYVLELGGPELLAAVRRMYLGGEVRRPRG